MAVMHRTKDIVIVKLGPDLQKSVAKFDYKMRTTEGSAFVAGVVSWIFHRGFTSLYDFVDQVRQRVSPVHREVEDEVVRERLCEVFALVMKTVTADIEVPA